MDGAIINFIFLIYHSRVHNKLVSMVLKKFFFRSELLFHLKLDAAAVFPTQQIATWWIATLILITCKIKLN